MTKKSFHYLVIALLKPRYQFEAECIQSAIKGIGTNNKVNY